MRKGTLMGIYNLMITDDIGTYLGGIVWDQLTGLITGVYVEQKLAFLDQDIIWVDGRGFEACPAGIDPHVHARPGQPEKEDQAHLQAACIEGGIGTIITQPNGNPPFTRIEQLAGLVEPWKNSPITVRHNIGATQSNLEEIALLGRPRDSRLGNLKGFHASSTGDLLIDDEPTQRMAAEAAARAGLIYVVHAEDEAMIKHNRQAIEQKRSLCLSDHGLIRTSLAEIRAIEQVIRIGQDIRGPIHVCHVSTVGGFRVLEAARQEGLDITWETCPHYWRLHDGLLDTMKGRAKMNPPLRTEEERAMVRALLCKSRGQHIMVASDHAPHSLADKANQDYDKCPSGVPGTQALLLTVYDLKARGQITAQRFVELTSRNTALRFGFNKGELAAGRDADIVLINPGRITPFSDQTSLSLCGWTPFDGMTVHGSIAGVVLGGKFVKGTLEPKKGKGGVDYFELT